MSAAHVLDRLDAYLDCEFDPAASAEIERHLEQCEACRAACDERRALISQVRALATYHGAPDSLRLGLRAEPGTAPARRPAARFSRLLATAAGLVLAAGLGAAVTHFLESDTRAPSLEEQVLASHIRSLLVADRLVDVASTDRHTVRPWFSGKLSYAPPVEADIGADDTLVGGRLDYLEGQPVSALVYRHGPHLLNLFVWPEPGASLPIRVDERRGYALGHWRQAGMTYWVASDLNPLELREFCERFLARSGARAGAPGEHPAEPAPAR